MIRIRRLLPTDDNEWLRLRLALWPGDSIAELRADMATIVDDPQQPVFVAVRPTGGLGGVLELSIHDRAPGCTTNRIGYIEGWYVDADLRQNGVGRRLVAAGEAWARSVGCCEMASDTDETYPHSPAAHLALGYAEAEPFRFYKRL